jgi:hypothetical protein
MIHYLNLKSWKDIIKTSLSFAFPSPPGSGKTTRTIIPQITSSKPDSAARLLATPGNTRNFNCDENCGVQYRFDQPFTCRSVTIRARNNYQSNRLIIQTSEDGILFNTITRLYPTPWMAGLGFGLYPCDSCNHFPLSSGLYLISQAQSQAQKILMLQSGDQY